EDPIDLTGLSPEQEDTDRALRRLLGTAVADRYADFCRLASGAVPLTVSRPLAGHALRELEGLMRRVLAAVLDAVAPDNAEEEKRRSDALKMLKSLDFDESTLQRAQKALMPQLTHRKTIERIVERLGLSPRGDIARNWIAITGAHGPAHEGSFHQSMKVDDE